MKTTKKTVKTVKPKKISTGKVVAIGAGIVMAASVAYLLLGPDGKKNQAKVKVWSQKMKEDIVTKLKKVKEITLPVYTSVINEVSDKYSKLKDIDKKEVEAIKKEAIKHWKAIVNKK